MDKSMMKEYMMFLIQNTHDPGKVILDGLSAEEETEIINQYKALFPGRKIEVLPIETVASSVDDRFDHLRELTEFDLYLKACSLPPTTFFILDPDFTLWREHIPLLTRLLNTTFEHTIVILGQSLSASPQFHKVWHSLKTRIDYAGPGMEFRAALNRYYTEAQLKLLHDLEYCLDNLSERMLTEITIGYDALEFGNTRFVDGQLMVLGIQLPYRAEQTIVSYKDDPDADSFLRFDFFSGNTHFTASLTNSFYDPAYAANDVEFSKQLIAAGGVVTYLSPVKEKLNSEG